LRRFVRLKREYPGWGAPKIWEKLRQRFAGPHLPSISTVHAVLDRHHLVKRRRRRRHTARGTELSRPTDPNALWCADYDLGYFDDETCRLEPIENPFGPKVLPMSSE
jgi:putative transposase